MIDLLSVSRAARLAGVSRGSLQQSIRRGDIQTFEGKVPVSDLLRLYPSVSLEHSGALERVESIKANAIPRSHDNDHHLPSPEVLVSRLRALSEALSAQVSRGDALQGLIERLRNQIHAILPERNVRERLLGWLDTECAQIAEQTQSEPRQRLLAKDNFLRLMAASVKMIPSGHEFFVEGSEPILDAAVRAGLRLNYGCANGNCGSCKARVIAGEVSKVRHHDYVLSAREQQMGYMLACCHTAVTDLTLEAAEAHTSADLPIQLIRTQVRKLESKTDNLMLLQLQTPRTQTLRFMAGQRVELRLDANITTELPIASCPCNGRTLHFYVRRGRDAFSNSVFDRQFTRESVAIRGPFGDFVLKENDPAPAVFIAFDDGIAPIKSLIEHAVSIDGAASLHLYWSTTRTDDHTEGCYLEGWCRALTDALDNFAFTPLIDATTEDLLAFVRTDLIMPAQACYYLAGPFQRLELLAKGLEAIGVGTERIANSPVG